MQLAARNFGLSGHPTDHQDHDELFGLFGKKARRRREERKSIRYEKKRLKNDDMRADIEAKRAQTAIMEATMLDTPDTVNKTIAKPIGIGANTPMSFGPTPVAKSDVPMTQKAGFAGNTLVIVVGLGILIIGRFIFKQQRQPPPPYILPPTSISPVI